MTALTKYQRIEATGLWRPDEDSQRREVIASIGDATLVISDLQDRALTHWSLPAVVRANPGERPAIYHPDGDPRETLELSTDEAEMIAAIEKLRDAIEKRRPHPGRLRLGIVAGMVSAIAALAAFWLPGALVEHSVNVVPAVKQREIGQLLLQEVERVTGQRCTAPQSDGALTELANRLSRDNAPKMTFDVVPGGLRPTVLLPGQQMVMTAQLFEDFEIPDIVAGFILAEQTRGQQDDPLAKLLHHAGTLEVLRLLTTGSLSPTVLRSYTEELLRSAPAAVSDDLLLAAFKEAQVKSTPYAYALDVSGETSLHLIEADPYPAEAPRAVLSDSAWLRLQAICES